MATTIAAIASPPGGGRRGVIRVSGPEAERLARATCRFEDAKALEERGAWRARFEDARGSVPAVVLWMPGPRSYTREDVAEIHLPGAAPLVEAALARLVELGAVTAGPGEFTRRAFENGRIDLTRAEGVLALVEAAGEEERRAATELLFGGLGERVAGLRDALLDSRVLCEGSLDFDEADTGHVPAEEIASRGAAALERLDEATRWEARRARSAGRPRIALVGAPNAGKSTLFNALAGGRALVAELEGTTRDPLRAGWSVAGVECELLDTAGLDANVDQSKRGDPDREAQRLARAEHEAADLAIWVVDARSRDLERLRREREGLPRAAGVLAWTQIDREGAAARPPEGIARGLRVAAVSGRERTGLDALEHEVAGALGLSGPGRGPAGAGRDLSARHLEALKLARERLAEALEALRRGAALDLVAEALRAAMEALDDIDGRTTPEDVLDRLFARFCIGK